MLNEILNEFEKVKEKDKSTKESIRNLFKSMKNELKNLEYNLETFNNEMNVKLVFITQDENPNEMSNISVNRTVAKISELDINKNYNTTCNNFYGGLSKLGKIMSKNMESEQIGAISLYEYDKNLLYQVNFLLLKDNCQGLVPTRGFQNS